MFSAHRLRHVTGLAIASLAWHLPCQASLTLQSNWKASAGFVQFVEFAPDGRSLVTADGGGVGRLWSSSGEPIATLRGQRAPMFRAHFSNDGQRLVSTGYDGSGWIWSRRGQLLQRLQLHRAATADVFLLSSTRRAAAALVSSSDDGTVVLHDAQGKTLWQTQLSGTARQLRVDGQGSLIAASSDDGQIHLVRPSSDRRSARVQSFQTAHGRINLLRFSPDRRELAAAGSDGTVGLYGLNGRLQRSLKASDSGWSRGVSYCSDGGHSTLLSVGDDGSLRQWTSGGTLINRLALSPGIALTAVDCGPTGRLAAVVNAAGQLWMITVTPH